MLQQNKYNMTKSKGFTLIEIMLVMAVAAVMMTMKLQDDKLEMTQLQARKLGATELFVYNLGVQKYLSSISGIKAAPGDYPKVFTGVDWLKNTTCIDPSTTADSDYVPCAFLSATNGKTTFGSMSFTTTIDYDPSSGYTARTVLSTMSGTVASDTNAGVLGLAALVASGAFVGSDASATTGGSGGSIIYCPDISPMPSGMAAICNTARDQVVMIVNTNGANDTWLRVDHGNMMAHAIEFQGAGSVPTSDSDLSLIHPNMRQIRNVARIYNATLAGGSDTENLYIGNRVGADIVSDTSHSAYPSLAENAVIIDADQEVAGELVVQNGITVNSGGVSVENGNVEVLNGDVIARNDIKTVTGNADINGWITSGGDITSDNGDIIANNGEVRSKRFVDSDNPGYYLDPRGNSLVREISSYKVRNNPSVSSTLRFVSPRIDMRANDSGTTPTELRGYADVSNLYVKKGTYSYPLEELLPNLTFVGSYKATKGDGTSPVNASSVHSYCGGSWRTRVYIIPLRDTISALSAKWSGGSINGRTAGNTVRWVTRSGGTYRYYARGEYNFDYDGSIYDRYAQAILQFYCYRP